MNTLFKSALYLGATVAALHSGHAAVLMFGNDLGNDTFSGSSGGAFGGSAIGIAGTKAESFTTGSSSLVLDHLTLAIHKSGTPTVNVALYTGTASAPTTLYASLSTVDSIGTGASTTGVKFTGTSVNLTAGTTYWIVVQNDAPSGLSTITWDKGGASAGNGNLPTASNGSGYTFNTGFTSTTDAFGGTTSNPNTQWGNFAVYSTTAVPEPRAYAIIAGIGLCAFAAYRRRALVKA